MTTYYLRPTTYYLLLLIYYFLLIAVYLLLITYVLDLWYCSDLQVSGSRRLWQPATVAVDVGTTCPALRWLGTI